MKEKYCSYCGRELENKVCACAEFIKSINEKKNNKKKIHCDTCRKMINEDALYCPYCGMAVQVDGNDKILQAELKGDYAIDVLKEKNEELKKEILEGNDYERVVAYEKINKQKQQKIIDVGNWTLKLVIIALALAIILVLLIRLIIPVIEQEYLQKETIESESTTESSATIKETTIDVFASIRESVTQDYLNSQMTEDVIESEEMTEEGQILEPTAETHEWDDGSTDVEETVDERDRNASETTKAPLLKNTWVRQDGYFYCLDENGDPVVDEWVEEKDERGNKAKYYFDIDGRLVVNSWINEEYYVGNDGKLLVNTTTPDGVIVDKNGKAVIKTVDTVETDAAGNEIVAPTYVYKETEVGETIVESQVSTSNLEIKDTDPKKDIYIITANKIKETVTKGKDVCNITYYLPIIAGKDMEEINVINEKIGYVMQTDFKTTLINKANSYDPLPKTILLNVIQQRTMSKNIYMFLVTGKLTPQHGLYEKFKYRFRYNRKNGDLIWDDISNG